MKLQFIPGEYILNTRSEFSVLADVQNLVLIFVVSPSFSQTLCSVRAVFKNAALQEKTYALEVLNRIFLL